MPMQGAFLVLALGAALVELHTGTFYLAAIAAIALLVFVLGFFVPESTLLPLFVAGCFAGLALVWIWRRRLPHGRGLPDLDTGQDVTIAAIVPHENRLIVTYRGTRWDAVMEGGAPPAIGSVARIVRKSGSVLHLAIAPDAAGPAPQQEIS